MIKIGNKSIDTLYVGSKLVQQMYLGNRKIYPEEGVIPKQIKDAMVLWYDLKRQGATNESMAANPKLIDLSGNGHDATCYNFAWSGMSGIGGYTNFGISGSRADSETLGTQKWLIKSLYNNAEAVAVVEPITAIAANFNGRGKTFIINIDGIPSDAEADYLKVKNNISNWYQNLSNGNNTVTFSEDSEGYFVFRFLHDDISNITIEILPEYPNALVSDGVDDYAYVDGLPLLNKEDGYTVIAKRKRFDDGKRGAIATKLLAGVVNGVYSDRGAFILELVNSSSGKQIYNFGSIINLDDGFTNNDIVYLTDLSYNGTKQLSKGVEDDLDCLKLFTVRDDGYTPAAIYSFLLFNRTLTEDEINWVKANLIGE